MRTMEYYLIAFTITLAPGLFAQYSYEFEYEDPNPALEYRLDEKMADVSYSVFSYEAETIFSQLQGGTDPIEVELILDSEYSFTLQLSDYIIAEESVFDPEIIFTKSGTIEGETNSKVFGVFTQNYFWINIWIDDSLIKIRPARTYDQSLIEYTDTYIVSESIVDNTTYVVPETCDDYYIEISVMGDKSLYDMYNGDISFIEGEYIILYYETQEFLMDNFNPENGLLTVRILSFDVFSNKIFPATDPDASNYIFQSYMEGLHPCFNPDIHVLLTGAHSGGIVSQVGTLCIIHPNSEPYPGLALVGCEGGINFAGITHAHEICHVLGAFDFENCLNGECIDDCVLMCSTNSCTHSLLMDECNRPKIINELKANCSTCLTEYTEVDCGHCLLTIDRVFDESLWLVRGCPERNRFSITFSYTTDCSESDIQLDITFNNNVISILNKGYFVDVDYNIATDGTSKLIGPLLEDLPPESTRSFTIEVEIKANAPNSGLSILTPIIFDFWINDVFYNTQNIPRPKFISPYNLPSASSVYLSDFYTPDLNGFSLNPGNVTDCSYNNTPFRVFGDFVVDEDYCFNNTYIIMEPGAKLIIPRGVTCTINSSKILGCAEMWESIFVEEEGNLIVENGQIEDAITAVDFEKNSSFISTSSIYHNNNIAINATLSGPGSIDFHMPGGNKITADDVLPKEPFEGFRAKAGIWLENVNSVSIEGEPPHIAPGTNRFRNLTNGIVLFNTDAFISNFHIYDIKSPAPTSYLTDDMPDGHAIYVNGTSGSHRTAIGSEETRDNYINSSHTGILVTGAEVEIKYCNIYKAISGIILGYKPRGESTVTHNLIDVISRGIQLRLPTSLNVDISNNRITTYTSNSIGIESLSS